MNSPNKPRLAKFEPAPSANGQHPEGEPTDLNAEIDSLKDVLRDAYSRLHKLSISIRRQKKQSRLLKTTLNSLRQLQQVGA